MSFAIRPVPPPQSRINKQSIIDLENRLNQLELNLTKKDNEIAELTQRVNTLENVVLAQSSMIADLQPVEVDDVAFDLK